MTQVYENLEQLSERTKLPKSWWYSKIRNDNGPPCLKVGKYLLFVPEHIDHWLQKQKKLHPATGEILKKQL